MQQLKQRLAQGEQAAFVELYQHMGDRLYRFVLSRTGSDDLTTDVIQETFVRLIRYHRRFRKVDNIDAWVIRVARNEMIRMLEKQPHDLPLDQPVVAPADRDQLEDREWIANLLDGIEWPNDEIIQLKVFAGLTFREIAEFVGLSPSTVATNYRRTMHRLSLKLDTPDKNKSPTSRTQK
ncbi:MAG: RNA polymerase sigma factor [Pirellulaceae bacterium]